MSSLKPDDTSYPFGHIASPHDGQERPTVAQEAQLRRQQRKFVLCFDGTGNKFAGTEADSNILKIYRMLDRTVGDQFHYYQPGIGTYVSTGSLTRTSRWARFKAWYAKQKDSAVGTSFADHVMGGYKFLMRYYAPGNDIYLFGFSRGAYTARFLAEMLDHVGLLSAGNEEMARFAWSTFQKWQTREERTDEDKKRKEDLINYMCAFRETFSRPVRRIRFLGLFDTVNSVPHFENAWMKRSKFPYTARSTAKVIRHAVAIDERRAKFRQDLISETKRSDTHSHSHWPHQHWPHWHHKAADEANNDFHEVTNQGSSSAESKLQRYNRSNHGLKTPVFRDKAETSGIRSLRPGRSSLKSPNGNDRSVSPCSQSSLAAICRDDDDSDGEEQDIQEVWFAGCHADIGGGWSLEEGEHPLSHIPLVWMVREAQRAGLNFDETKLRALNCYHDELFEESSSEESPGQPRRDTMAPEIHISKASPVLSENGPSGPSTPLPSPAVDVQRPLADIEPEAEVVEQQEQQQQSSPFHDILHTAAVAGKIHDVLCFNNGAGRFSVISWNVMEWMPFRRLDMMPNGRWKTISWPLPKGEVRDIPPDVVVHHSVIKRMEHDEEYRPGNLIVGGGGRGVRRAPKEAGIGKWKVLREKGDPVGECHVRA